MRRLYQAAGLVFLALAVFTAAQAREYTYFTPIGPGAGFFPFWLGVGLAALSLTWFVNVSFQPVEPMPSDFVPDRAGTMRIISLLVALVLFTWLLHPLGFRLAMLGFLLFLLSALGRQHLAVTAALALAGSFGVYEAFQRWLGVHLPVSSIEFLESLGL